MFFLLYRHADDVGFDDFPKISDHLPKISEDFQNCSERQTNVSEHFPRISENFRRCPKISEDFRGRPEDVSMIHQGIKYNLRDKQKQKAGIVTSLNDTTLTKVTYGKYATRAPDGVAYGIYEWFSSQ